MRTIGIFDFWKKRKQKSADFPKVAFRDLMDFLNIDPTSDRLSEATYLTCLKVLGEGLAKLPLALQMVTENGGVKDMTGLALWRTVKVRPNKYMSPTVFWTSVENNRNHFGNSYVWIDRKRNGGVELWVLPGDCVKIELDSLRDLSDMKDITYIYTSPNSGEQFRIASMDILHFRNSVIFDGLVGMSVREKLRASFDGAMMSQEMLNELYRNHFVPKAAIQFDVSSFVEKDLETQYLKSLQDYADGKSESGSSFIPLLPGTNIVPLNIKLTDGQFLELRKYSALQIAAAFGIKPNHLNDYDKSSYANSEAQQLAFYTDTMLYILKQYEEELNFKLLSEEQQKAGYRFKFNLAAVLRGDTKTQVESLSRGISSGLYTPDEARRNIDLPSKPGGDQLYFNGSNIPIVLSGTQYGNAPQKSVFTLANRGRSGIIEIRKKPVFGDGHRIADNEPDGNGGSGGESGGSGGESGGSGGESGGSGSAAASDSASGNIKITDEAIEKVPETDIFSDEKKNRRYQQANKDLLKEAQKYPVGTEVSRIYDENMNPIKDHGYVVGEKLGQVRIDDHGKPYHAFHNHPSGETFSPEDCINISNRDNMMSLTAVGNNSSVFCIQRSFNANAAGYRDYLMNKVEESRFINGRYSYIDIKNFDITALSDESKVSLQKELVKFCNECVVGGKQYGFNFAYSRTNRKI